jgi:WD40 repeat protein
VWDVAFVDKTTLFSRGRDETIRFWDTKSGHQLRVLPAKVCAVSGDGSKLFFVSESKPDVVEIWNAVNWKREATLDLKEGRPCRGLMVDGSGTRFGAVYGDTANACERTGRSSRRSYCGSSKTCGGRG